MKADKVSGNSGKSTFGVNLIKNRTEIKPHETGAKKQEALLRTEKGYSGKSAVGSITPSCYGKLQGQTVRDCNPAPFVPAQTNA